MARSKKAQQNHDKAARACEGKARTCTVTAHATRHTSPEHDIVDLDSGPENTCNWPGGVANHEHVPRYDVFFDLTLDDSDDELEIEEMEPEQYLAHVGTAMEQRAEELTNLQVKALKAVENAYSQISMRSGSSKEDAKKWRAADRKLRTGVHTGTSDRTDH